MLHFTDNLNGINGIGKMAVEASSVFEFGTLNNFFGILSAGYLVASGLVEVQIGAGPPSQFRSLLPLELRVVNLVSKKYFGQKSKK